MTLDPIVYSAFPPTNIVIKVQNKSNETCFQFSVLSGIHPITNDLQLVSHCSGYESELDMNRITYSVDVHKIS